jgi:hypothetical protein
MKARVQYGRATNHDQNPPLSPMRQQLPAVLWHVSRTYLGIKVVICCATRVGDII